MSLVLLEHPEDGIALIRMNRPEVMNALNNATRQELAARFEESIADDSVRVIVVTGNQKAFVAGADLKEFADLTTSDWAFGDSRRMWKVVAGCPKPIVAAVNGFALGGGCELALHCDIIVAGQGAKMGLPEIGVGVLPGGGGTQRLTRAVGKYKALKMMLTAEWVSGQEAHDMGMVSEVVADEEVLERAIAIARKVARMPPLGAKLIKEVTLAGMDAALETGLILERKAFEVLFSTEDQKEGAAAFIEKRKPEFKGR
ncbi:MAG: enoyl-CoA hydratase [Magnetovibrio sp.]|nr:enoyl-CoA hydratase [Magnetovibrio sp.]|tara:strand:+ start:197 stop:967 length:771 start_codon:yes stop_codon:yes gene_type:complete